LLLALVLILAGVGVSLEVVTFLVATFLVVFDFEAAVVVVDVVGVFVVFFALRFGLLCAKISKSDSSESELISVSFFDFGPFLVDFLEVCSDSEPENTDSTISLG
jgi:hypothetical protein